MFRRMTYVVLLAASAAALALVNTAAAQPPERGPGRGQGMFGGRVGNLTQGAAGLMLLQADKVQKELDLSTEQVEKVKDLAKSARESMQKATGDLRDLSPEERRAKLRDLGEKITTQVEETQKKLKDILKPEQVERLKQLRLQLAGPAALEDADVVKELNITDEQKTKLHEVREKARGSMGGGFRDLQNLSREEREKKMAEMREKMQKNRQSLNDDLMKVLTTEQQQKLEKMKGKKVDWKLTELLPMRGPGVPDLPARGEGRRGRPGRNHDQKPEDKPEPKTEPKTDI